MIRAIILDIDGVIVGEQIGVNSPWPHLDVIRKLKQVRSTGIPISLVTAKPHFAIGKIIRDSGLKNAHVTDGGAVIIDPLGETVIKQHEIPSGAARCVVEALVQEGIYAELYTTNEYVIQESQRSEITNQHTHILQAEPRIVASIVEVVDSAAITKIMPIVSGESAKESVESVLQRVAPELTLSWGVHPVALPLQFGIITALGVSKRSAAQEVARSTGIPLSETLGVGDSTSDWQFMELCSSTAAMGNASQELEDLVRSRGEQGFIGPTVDENGIIPIFDHFIAA